MAASELDYDDIISQNILIKKEESSANAKPIVQVLTKQHDNHECYYNNRSDPIYPLVDENMSAYLETTLHEEDGSDSARQSGEDDEDDEKEVTTKKTMKQQQQRGRKHKLMSDEDEDEDEDDDDSNSSDSDWGRRNKRAKAKAGTNKCNECDKKFPTKRGLMMHQRSHDRQRQKAKKSSSD